MADIIIPAFLASPSYDHTKILEDLRKMKTDRLLLAISYLDTDRSKMEPVYERLSREIDWFHRQGITVGVWFWSFIIVGKNDFTKMVTVTGYEGKTFAGDEVTHVCPFDPGYIEFMQDHIRRLAALHPDLILFDDDYSLGHHSSEPAQMCLCALHRKRMEQSLGRPVETENFFEEAFSGKPNELRSAFMKASGASLEEFAAAMRRALDEVDPSIRMGQCACIAGFDGDGTDAFTVSGLLAGKTKPYLRLSGAPYWQDRNYPGGSKDRSSLVDIIEMNRLEASWCQDRGIEIVSEGDTYPRPRTHCPASYLNLFDAALRADGSLSGIQMYVIDYVSSAGYEHGYIDSHLRIEDDLNDLTERFSAGEAVGLRVYESMKKIEDADFTWEKPSPSYVRNQFFARSVRFTSHLSIPTTFAGPGAAGVMFGESARHFGKEALEKPLILDVASALILKEVGIDVGLEKVTEYSYLPSKEYFADGEVTLISKDLKGLVPYAEHIEVSDRVKVLSRFESAEGGVASYSYENSCGMKFLVFAVNAFRCHPDYFRSYARQKQTFSFLHECGADLPVVTYGHPDLYVIAKKKDDTFSVALFNCFADEIFDLKIELSESFDRAEFFRADGEHSGKTAVIRHLGAYDWCYAEFSCKPETETV